LKTLTLRSTLFILLSILVFSCGEDEQTESEKELFKYLPNTYTERQFKFDSGNGFYITLPDCYQIARFRQFSIKNDDNYHCQENQSYFSIDRFSPSDIDYYDKYFNTDSTKSRTSQEKMLKYVLDSRASNLEIHSSSIFSEVKTKSGLKMIVAAVKGSETSYSNPLYYQYGIFSIDDELYVVQFIVNDGDISFFHEDIMTIFKSIRLI